ncbi:MAG: hypothetical protein HQL71_11150 [Magnetococcales bacterium]|nr:hypothetical protein [Magnetococcales bacterium]
MVAMPKNVLAVSLGEIQVFRTEANMFHGEIPIALTDGEKVNKIMVSTGNRTNYSKELGAEFDASIVEDGEQKFLVITGKNPQETPFFTLLVSVDLTNRTVSRNYPVQFDGQITPLPPRKLEVSSVEMTKKNTEKMATTVIPSTAVKIWERYLLWWVAGGVLAVILFWIWWKQGSQSDEDLLILAREEKAKLPVESWETLLAADEEAEPGAVPQMDRASSVSTQKSQKEPQIDESKPDTEEIFTDDSAANLLKSVVEPAKLTSKTPKVAPQVEPTIDPVVAQPKPQAVKLTKPKPAPKKQITPPSVVGTPKPAPKPSKSKPSGRLSASIMKASSTSKSSKAPTANKDATTENEDTEESTKNLSIEAVMSSLVQVLDDKNKKNQKTPPAK